MTNSRSCTPATIRNEAQSGTNNDKAYTAAKERNITTRKKKNARSMVRAHAVSRRIIFSVRLNCNRLLRSCRYSLNFSIRLARLSMFLSVLNMLNRKKHREALWRTAVDRNLTPPHVLYSYMRGVGSGGLCVGARGLPMRGAKSLLVYIKKVFCQLCHLFL